VLFLNKKKRIFIKNVCPQGCSEARDCKQEPEIFSSNFVSADRYRGDLHKEELFIRKKERTFSCLDDPNDETFT